MDISSIFPSSDNLYKFLFMGGIFMIAFSFIYPLEKEQKIELEINLYNKQVEFLNKEINELGGNVEKLKIKTQECLLELGKQNGITDSALAKKNIERIKSDYNKIFSEAKIKENEVTTKDIILKYEKQKIQLLESQVNSFSIFRWGFLILGTAFTFFGLIRWYKTSRVAEKLQKIELEKRKKELTQ